MRFLHFDENSATQKKELPQKETGFCVVKLQFLQHWFDVGLRVDVALVWPWYPRITLATTRTNTLDEKNKYATKQNGH